ncbi:MAG: MCE family protein [Nocardia sp.]|nr:MCE family protein [Nocardia sp.]
MRWREKFGRAKVLEDYNKALLGVLALGILVIVVVAALVINSMDIGDRRVDAEFAQAAQLGSGDQVTVAGVPVGHVTSVRLSGEHVAVSMSIHRDVPLGADTKAAIKLTTLLGNRYVEIDPAGGGSLPSDRIPLAHTEVPYDLESALADATSTFEQVDADQMAKSLTDLSGQLNGLPQLIPAVMNNVKTLSGIVAERRGQIGALLQATAKLTGVLRGQQANLGVLFNQGGDMLREIVSRKQAIESMVGATTKLVDNLTPLAVGDQPEIREMLTNLNDMTGMLSRNDALLRNILQILPVPWRSWANLTGNGPELEANAPNGALVDSFMCALVRQVPSFHMAPYSQECR